MTYRDGWRDGADKSERLQIELADVKAALEKLEAEATSRRLLMSVYRELLNAQRRTIDDLIAACRAVKHLSDEEALETDWRSILTDAVENVEKAIGEAAAEE